jgi:hypothetical protein
MQSRRLLRLVLFACFAITPALAQTGSATVEGSVTDPTGAVVPNADVTLTQVATSVAQRTKTNAAGLFVFPASPIGAYKISVSSAGMETWEGQIVLQAGLAAEVNVSMRVEAASTQASFKTGAPLPPLLEAMTRLPS